MDPHLLDHVALAAKLRISPSTLRKLVKQGLLPQPWHGRFFYWPQVVRTIEVSIHPPIDRGEELRKVEEYRHLPLPHVLRTDPAP